MTTALISKTIIVYRPQTTYFKLTCRASDCQYFIGHRSSYIEPVEMCRNVVLRCFILVGVSSCR
ncbi:MAG: hypothetical protein EWV53_05815 [Microcystis panniformis Mp_MB_F_20051200_S9]|uniref:Uncharacterized protein n=1 Tax=Microcystis panniformis Mp_MB_F_20051200_S9 TaxID=2486223 RepID=A0A552Q6B1_9CHRO|nr:MAG: hypothetical protein EWV43_08125 [Microcystis panniformis Mp_MB_F_20080800_S26D]TRV52205.1 MAG: hypothetical protein EWV42_08360 [Microcystis panniformis Mp_GB_SS_20050300_S99D]TRV53712.1 MAG: hypothetical protein EWV87_02245 [Microcystis panniformis Mp_GB_SS_20050300_S99]TRV61885.1 MAG: hypothetical protein EWV86_14380 [Microcystis panniformis Mp_MB_F_20051200_S9D]TRV63029.1 MAG: hypothetical protein EWV69_04550 [Microcystis panniformis Mp_MB_F_20080800_S26]TRV64756.1 MAG: hypothetica